MISIATIATLDLILGTIAALGLSYLLYSETLVVHYRRFFRLITIGLLVYAISGPIIETFTPALIHAIHATAAVFISIGLYDLIRGDLHRETDLRALVQLDAPGFDSDVELPDE
jgi:hypothetical protein